VRVTFSEAFNNPGVGGKHVPHSGSGIILSDLRHGVIEHSEAYRNGSLSESLEGGPVGIWAWDGDDILIEHNHSHHNRVAGPKDGGGLDLDGGVTNSMMQYNYSHDNDGAGYLICQFPGARPFAHNVARFNISVNDGRRNSYGSIFFFGGVSDTDVYNNTVVLSPVAGGSPRALHFMQDAAKNVSIRNNIFVTSGGLPLVDVEPGQVGLTLQGNNYFSAEGPMLIRWEGVNYGGLPSWREATGQERIAGHALGFSLDPGFIGPAPAAEATHSFRLRADSPLIDAGLDLSALFRIGTGSMDFFGAPVPSGAGFDVGATEVGPPSSVPSGRPGDAC
jgi:hypothetical protein